MITRARSRRQWTVALLAEGVDRNIREEGAQTRTLGSPSSRRAWIEIASGIKIAVDVESPSSRRAWIEISQQIPLYSRPCVALLAEGVDRNHPDVARHLHASSSPSSRRAWIEMFRAIYFEGKG